MSRVDVETIVIGGGLIGLAIALAAAHRGQEVVVLERNSGTGQEVSSRSSEVIHAGIYYPANSKKSRFCTAGRRRLYHFAEANGVPIKRLGKLVVATSPSEREVLQDLERRARENGVEELKLLEKSDIHALEPDLSGSAALWSPTSGIIDSHALIQAFEGNLTTRGGLVVLETTATRVEFLPSVGFEISVESSGGKTTVKSRNLFVAAGLGMAALRYALPCGEGYSPPRLHYAKGHYFGLTGRVPFQRLVYPVPVEGGLGTHLTLDMQGRARFGPDVKWIDQIDYSFVDPGGALSAQFERDIRRYWPGLPEGSLQPAYTGIRPKISGKGEPVRDFEIHGPKQHGIPRMVTLYGIESPGLTSSLALAEHCCELVHAEN